MGSIKRRKIPRDVLMATYYMRYTNQGDCTGCGTCVDWCPVDALIMEGEFPVVDEEWCIGCGVCVAQCPNSAARLKLRTDKVPPRDFGELHQTILEEKGLK
ncbi:indolepyruvate ferredoxin oxidoreductase subunit alpha [Chloroflexota bacterium]